MSVAPGPMTPSDAYWSHVTDLMSSLKGRPDPAVYDRTLVTFTSNSHSHLDDFHQQRESLLRAYETLRVLSLYCQLPETILEVLVSMDANAFRDEIGDDFQYQVFSRVESNLEYVIDRVRLFIEKLQEQGEIEVTFSFLRPRVPETTVKFSSLLSDGEKKRLFITEKSEVDIQDPEIRSSIIQRFDDIRFDAISVLGRENKRIRMKYTSLDEARKWLVYGGGMYEKLKDDPIALSLARQIILENEIEKVLEASYTQPGVGVQHALLKNALRSKKGRLFPRGHDAKKRLEDYVVSLSEK